MCRNFRWPVLVKPVDLEQLASALERWLDTDPGVEPAAGAERAEGGGSEPEAAVLDLTLMVEAYGSIDDEVKEMLGFYRSRTRGYIEDLEAALEAEDTEAAILAAHTIAGASKTAGAREVGALFSRIEVALGQDDGAAVDLGVGEITEAWARLENALGEVMEG